MLLSRFVVGMSSVCLMLLAAGAVSGQDYPQKPIRISTGGAGGGGDFQLRLIGPYLSERLGQQVIVDNRAPIVATETVSKAPPDGYTLLVQGGTPWIRPLLEKTTWDPVKDFSPVSLLSVEVSVLVVHPSVPANSVKELIALAKANPGALNYGSSGVGSTNHLATELFKSMAGINIVHVSYKGNAPSITALLSGETQLMLGDAGIVAPHVKSGKMRALAVTTAQPSALVPGLPTVAASGLPGYEAVSMTGMFAPGRTPEAIVRRLNQEVVRALNLPDVKEKYFNARLETVGSSPEEFAARIKSEMARMGKVIKDAGIRAE